MSAIRPLRGMRGMGPIRGDKPLKAPAPILAPSRMPETNLPDQVQAWARVMSEALARICWRWRQKLGSVPSAPELLVYDWLTARKITFVFQSSNGGGRRFLGGTVSDFVLPMGGGVIVLRIQGTYWHGSAEVKRKDEANKFRLLASKVLGKKVIAVADLWESDIYKARERVCRDALSGRDSRE